MRKFLAVCITFSLLLAWTGAARPGDDDGRAIVNKAIEAAGGEAKLAKFQSVIMKEKGTYYGMGDGLPFTSVVHMKRPAQFKMEIVGVFSMGIDGDKGWMKSDKGIMDMPKEQVEMEQANNKAGWIASLLPLKDKAYTLNADGSAKIGDMMTSVVKVSRKDYPTVKLFFDQKTDLLVKSEFSTKSSEQKFKEVLAESYFSDYRTVDGCKTPHKIALKHDGKIYVDAEVTELKAAKLDAKTFAKPASD